VDRERLLNSLHEQIAAYDDGDAGLVLAPEALHEANQLLDHLGTPEGTDFIAMEVGLTMYHAIDTKTNIYMDDLAFGKQRIGCNP